MIARPATPGPWVDTSWRITPAVATALTRAGKIGVTRYVPLPGNSSLGDISGVEVGCIQDAGLELLLVQHVRRPPWLPKTCNGDVDAGAATILAEAVGYPAGAHLFLDLEGAAGVPADCRVYVDTWSAAVIRSGFRPGLYVGYSALLSPDELYELPYFDCYWSDAGPRAVAVRGFAIKQHQPEVTIGGVAFDPDEVAPDALGGLPIVAGP